MSQFFGNSAISMDAKGRIAIPTRVREQLQECCQGRIVLTAHTENKCLHVFPEQKWHEVLQNLKQTPSFNERFRKIKLTLVGYANTFELEANGRVLIPPTLREYAGLDKKLMLVGQIDSLELWDEKSFTDFVSSPTASDSQLPDGMQELALY